MERPLPRQPAPELTIDTLDGASWTLREQSPERFTMLVFYRGLHCPVCRSYLKKLTGLHDSFRERGVEILAVSMDPRERAEETAEAWSLGDLPVGYGLSERRARIWGLYLSHAISEDEPELFSEPGLFLIEPDGTLFYAAINSMPFGRPKLEDMVEAVDFVREKEYPARGEVPFRQPTL